MSDQAFSFCIAELRGKVQYFAKSGLIPTYDGPRNSIVKSDSYIDETLREELARAFRDLAAEQAGSIDWHPGSNGLVQNLVHPSMYPFIFDRSPFIQDEVVGVSNALDLVGQGESVKGQSPPVDRYDPGRSYYSVGSGQVEPWFWSYTYQWLPANVQLRQDGSVQFTSYVNNLHPTKFPDIYKILERIISKAIPAWDQCLRETIGYSVECSAGREESRFEQITEAHGSDDSLWTPDFKVETFKDMDLRLTDEELKRLDDNAARAKRKRIEVDPDERERRRAEGLPPLTPNLSEKDIARAKWEKYKEPKYPEPKGFKPLDYTPKQSLRKKFKENGLQIIVKMASIELTPEKPEFPSGGWHLEGQMNEKIAATALYYLDSENVTPSHLAFRMQTDSYLNDDIQTSQDDYNWLERVLGTSLGASGSCTQNYGEVETRQGRLIAFPNVFQHRVSSFRLQDPTKPGYRRFIALWLVDPHRRVISTANVPPQQEAWSPGSTTGGSVANRTDEPVPRGLMTLEEAREHRLKLMDERTAEKARDHWERVEYNFYEH
ncbi:hypothetical protein Purlil1_12962 [Purpureocillium lilacinum]|uniref:DUF4246 domain-containing protein n=1 Tax=Purpureocillium lilacinum TaxID=33203 RepID=A0ABR0BFG4_PURLI|nr:hypothetical protein Purlil1_12962 [Purpureocillium lilacinum]